MRRYYPSFGTREIHFSFSFLSPSEDGWRKGRDYWRVIDDCLDFVLVCDPLVFQSLPQLISTNNLCFCFSIPPIFSIPQIIVEVK